MTWNLAYARRDDMVAEQCGGQRVAETVPVDGGDDRLPVFTVEECLALRRPTGRRSFIHGALEASADVAPARKRAALAEEDGDVGGVVGIEAPYGCAERLDVLVAKGVVLFASLKA